MANTYTKLDQALKDLIEAYNELEEEVGEKYEDDEDAYAHAIIEALETSVESAIEEHDSSTTQFATILSNLTEALEQLDPSAFDEDESEYGLDDVAVDVDDDYEGEDEEEDEDGEEDDD